MRSIVVVLFCFLMFVPSYVTLAQEDTPSGLNERVIVKYGFTEVILDGEPFEILGHRGEKIRRMNPGNFIALGTVSGEPVKELHFRLPPKPGAFARVLKLASCEMRTPEGQESTFSREGGVTVSFFKLNDELMEMVEAEGQSLQFWGMLENGKPLSIALEMTYLRDTPEGLTCEWYVIKKHRWTKLCRQSDGTATFEITSD